MANMCQIDLERLNLFSTFECSNGSHMSLLCYTHLSLSSAYNCSKRKEYASSNQPTRRFISHRGQKVAPPLIHVVMLPAWLAMTIADRPSWEWAREGACEEGAEICWCLERQSIFFLSSLKWLSPLFSWEESKGSSSCLERVVGFCFSSSLLSSSSFLGSGKPNSMIKSDRVLKDRQQRKWWVSLNCIFLPLFPSL